MVNAVVLLKVKREYVNQVPNELLKIEGITEVYAVAGRYDLVAILRARDDDQFATLLTEGMLKVEGIQSSETLIALRAFSKNDAE